MGKKIRNVNLDLIRCIAVFFVMSVHFFWNNGFYTVPIIGWRMYVMTTMRTMFIDCVPLFLMITGYLMCKKELSKKYYKGIVRVLGVFFICTMFIFIYRHIFQGMQFNVSVMIKELLGDAHYSWYVGMYVGLFCIIPFLNLSYNGLDSKNKKRVLILTWFVFTSMPSVLNYSFHIITEYFIGVYSITYYFIGAYIREYQDDFKLHKYRYLLLYIIIIAINSFINIKISYNQNFVLTKMVDYCGVQNVLSTTMLFIFLSSINLPNSDKVISKCLAKVSELSFGMYLLSWIMDQIVYPKLNSAVPVMEERLKYYIVVLPIIFFGSMILSAGANGIYKQCVYGCKKLTESSKSKTQKKKNS